MLLCNLTTERHFRDDGLFYILIIVLTTILYIFVLNIKVVNFNFVEIILQ